MWSRLSRTFPERLQKLRLDAGLSQNDLSRACGLTSSHIAKLEQGYRHPGMGTLLKLSLAFDLTLDQLIGKDRRPRKIKVKHVPKVKVERVEQVEPQEPDRPDSTPSKGILDAPF